MCPPRHFEVAYEINPWMDVSVPVDFDRAWVQWAELAGVLADAGATIETQEPVAGLPDQVFCANAGVVVDGVAVPARFRAPQRRPESAPDRQWFVARGLEVVELPPGVIQEGAGDALATPDGGGLIAGWGIRSDRAGAGSLGRRIRRPVHPVRLVDERLYHLDLAYCPLPGRRALVVPGAFDAAGRRTIEALVGEALVLDWDEASTFCANSVVVGDVVVMPACPTRVGRWLESRGMQVAVVDVSEFEKAGGACRCLTLTLDVGTAARPAEVAA